MGIIGIFCDPEKPFLIIQVCLYSKHFEVSFERQSFINKRFKYLDLTIFKVYSDFFFNLLNF